MSTEDWPDPDAVREAVSNMDVYNWGDCAERTITRAARAYLRMRERQPAEPALTIEQVIAACGGDAMWLFPVNGKWCAEVRTPAAVCRGTIADTPEAAIQQLGRDAIAKIKERHAADAVKLKELGLEP